MGKETYFTCGASYVSGSGGSHGVSIARDKPGGWGVEIDEWHAHWIGEFVPFREFTIMHHSASVEIGVGGGGGGWWVVGAEAGEEP